uniref:Uncharacterized protein n=1 Tax=Heterorhabditis bacteriophora TaxID=37862 RepID=A0A1I7XNM6_HETBA
MLSYSHAAVSKRDQYGLKDIQQWNAANQIASTRLHILQVTQVVHLLNSRNTVVQSISLLIVVNDRDIISIARTGSEKTITDSV